MKTPEEHEREMLEREQSVSTQLGEKVSAIICPKFVGETCLTCDLVYAYYRAKLGKQHVLREKAKDLNRKLRYYSSVILPEDPTTPVLFEYGTSIFNTLFGHATDKNSEYYGYYHPETGINFIVKKEVPPSGDKKQTQYTVEMRRQSTPLPDMGILQRLPNLDNILQLRESGKIKIITNQSLPEGRTEMRMLPSWLGPTYRKFYVEVPIHYVLRDEWNAIQSGKVNPFTQAGIGLKQTSNTFKPDVIIQPTGWGTPSSDSELDSIKKPPCWGTYDGNSPLCTDRCNRQWGATTSDTCKGNSPVKVDQNEQLRAAAEKLHRQ